MLMRKWDEVARRKILHKGHNPRVSEGGYVERESVSLGEA